MADNNCTSSVKELLENVKGTPYGVEVRRSKKGKPQAISFNETVDSFKDVIEDDCSNADKHGRFADTPASEGGAVAACEQYEADKAPCFSVGGKIKSTTVLKSRLAKKYKEKDSYEEYEDNKYKSLGNNASEWTPKSKSKSFPGRETKVYKKYLINSLNKGIKKALSIFDSDLVKISKSKQRQINLHDLLEQRILRDKSNFFKDDTVTLTKKEKGIIESKFNKLMAIIQERVNLKEGKDMKRKLTKTKKKITVKKKPTPKKQNSIPSEIYYQKTPDGKCILYLTKVWYNKMYPQYQKQIKEYFKWNPYDKFWKCKKKGAESILQKMEIPERNSSPIKAVTPEKIKPTKKVFLCLVIQGQSVKQTNNN